MRAARAVLGVKQIQILTSTCCESCAYAFRLGVEGTSRAKGSCDLIQSSIILYLITLPQCRAKNQLGRLVEGSTAEIKRRSSLLQHVLNRCSQKTMADALIHSHTDRWAEARNKDARCLFCSQYSQMACESAVQQIGPCRVG